MKKIYLNLVMSCLIINAAAQPGILDTDFGTGGKTFYRNGNAHATVGTSCIQKNGKILQVGNLVLLVRYDQDGTIDSSFGVNGSVHSNFSDRGFFSGAATGVTTQADGKILVSAYFNNSQPISYAGLIRYMTNGKLDSSFGINGIASTAFTNAGHSTTAYISKSIAIDSDGNIIIGGYFSENDDTGGDVFGIALRYTSAGIADESFGLHGLANVPSTSANSENITDIAILSDGKILLAGSQSDNFQTTKFMVAKLLPDGNADESFGTQGIVTTQVDNNDISYINAMVVQDDNKIVTAGRTEVNIFLGKVNIALARYNSDGSLDESFGNNGVVTTQIQGKGTSARDVVIQKNKKILIGSMLSQGASITIYDFLLCRYDTLGRIDSSFGENGIVTTDFSDIAGQTSYDYLESINLQQNGKIVTSGTNEASSTPHLFILAQYNGDFVNQHPLITKIKRWIRNHTLNFEDDNPQAEYYVIEKSTGANNFLPVSRIKSMSTIATYTYSLPKIEDATAYRIKAVSKDNSVSYSSPINSNDEAATTLTIFPNPAKDIVNIRSSKPVTVYLQNNSGNVLITKRVTGNGSIDISQLKSGIYYITDNENLKRYKILKE